MSERKPQPDPDPAPTPEPEPEPEPIPVAGQNLEFERLPGETEAEFMARTRNQVPDSQSPTDVVPNRPNITMSPAATVPPEEPAQ